MNDLIIETRLNSEQRTFAEQVWGPDFSVFSLFFITFEPGVE
jgi:hypothetical protein